MKLAYRPISICSRGGSVTEIAVFRETEVGIQKTEDKIPKILYLPVATVTPFTFTIQIILFHKISRYIRLWQGLIKIQIGDGVEKSFVPTK